ncbi:MAG: phosphate transport system protein [Gammaproteobacteria bacterium]|jgi:phosphate transport system protein
MDNINLSDHISQRFNKELEDVRNHVLAMGGLVESQLSNAIIALVKGDSKLGDITARNDYQVNAHEVSIDEECSRILARRQPTATDLRLVVAVIKTITDLERVGDEAKKIAKMASSLADKDRPKDGYREVQHLGSQVQRMLHDSLDCFARMDSEAAVRVVQADLEIDNEYESVIRQLVTVMMEDPRSIGRVLDVIWAVRALERIGDHATNMAEYVIYFVEGKDVRHISPDDLEEKLNF